MEKTLNIALLDKTMFWMGFQEHLIGTDMLRYAVEHWRRDMALTKELYPMIAKAFVSTPQRVERAMRHAMQVAFVLGDSDTIRDCFGNTIGVGKMAPTIGEFVARMAKVCADAD